MNKYLNLSDNEKAQLAKILADDINKKIVEPIQNHDIICLNRIVIDKDLLQSLIKNLLYNYVEILKYIDLTGISFAGLDVRYKNLEGTNADIDPQTVYQKSLKNTKLKNLDMSGKDFSGVNVERTDLEGTNADIDPQTVYQKSLKNTKLKNLDMSGKDFSGVNVEGTDLEGTNANIDPQTVYQKSLENTKLKNLDMSGKNFSGVYVVGADLEGTNADIDPQKVRDKSLVGTILKGIDMSDKDFTGVDIYNSDLDETNAIINYGDLRIHEYVKENDAWALYSRIKYNYCYLENARLKSCKLYNVKACPEDILAIAEATVMDSIYEDAKIYIKSLFN